jgi:predicted N-acetyltransferase YhbS
VLLHRTLADRTGRYLSILVVHPDAQKLRIGSRLLDHGLRNLVEPGYPTILEATPAGERLYASRGFVKELEFTLAEQYPGMGEMKFPLYRRPAET